MPYLITDDPDMTVACPECNRAGQLWQRTGESRDEDEAEFHCHACGADVEEPDKRPTKALGRGQTGQFTSPQTDVGAALAKPDVTDFDDLADALGGGD